MLFSRSHIFLPFRLPNIRRLLAPTKHVKRTRLFSLVPLRGTPLPKMYSTVVQEDWCIRGLKTHDPQHIFMERKVHANAFGDFALAVHRGDEEYMLAHIKEIDINELDVYGNTLLHYPPGSGSVFAVKFLLALGLQVDARNGQGVTPLGFAARSGDIEVMRALYGAGAQVNVRDTSGHTPLHLAFAHPQAVKLLLEWGADVHAVCNWGLHPIAEGADYLQGTDTPNMLSPLTLAAAGNRHACFDVLLNAGAQITNETIVSAVRFKGDLAMLEKVVTKENINMLFLDRTLLQVASEGGCLEIVKKLVEMGADVHYGEDGLDAFNLAAIKKEWQAVDYFMKELKMSPNKLETALRTAIFKDDFPLFEQIIALGVKVTEMSRPGFQLLHAAIQERRKEMTELLLKLGADVNQDCEGMGTPIFVAAKISADAVKLLLEHGANVNTSELPPISGSASVEIFELLRQHGADLSSPFLLHGLCFNRSPALSTFLSLRKCDFEYRNNSNLTPLECCALGANFEGFKILVQEGAKVDVRKEQEEETLYDHVFGGQGGTEEEKIAIMEECLKLGLAVDVKSQAEKLQPLMSAVCYNSELGVKWLLKKGANINYADMEGHTALHNAAYHGVVGPLRILLQAGANKEIKDLEGKTALDFAKEKGNEQIIGLLDGSISFEIPTQDVSHTKACSHGNCTHHHH